MNRLASLAISGGIHIACVSLAAIALPQQTVSGDLVLHYTFDQIRDGMGNHGRVVAVDRIKTTRGAALRFDGTYGYVDCGNAPSLNLSTAVTLEAWVRPADVPAAEVSQTIVGKQPECSLFARSEVWVQFPKLPRDRFEDAEAPFYSGMWHHLVATFNHLGASADPGSPEGQRHFIGLIKLHPYCEGKPDDELTSG